MKLTKVAFNKIQPKPGEVIPAGKLPQSVEMIDRRTIGRIDWLVEDLFGKTASIEYDGPTNELSGTYIDFSEVDDDWYDLGPIPNAELDQLIYDRKIILAIGSF